MTNVPEIRFKGFTDAWEQRKLGELYDIYSGQTPFRGDAENFHNPTTAWIKTTDLNNASIEKNEENISDKAVEKLRMLPIGSVLIAMYGGFNQIGRTGMLTYPATINQAISALPPVKEVDSYFLITELNHRVDEWKIVAASSRKYPNITKTDVENFVLKYPSLVEQSRIGTFFRTLDNTIAIYKRKLDGLRKLKKSYLQQMFPQAGEVVPRLRFNGFAKPWVKGRLGNSVEFLNGRAYRQEELLNHGKYRVLRVGNFNTNDFWYYSDLELDESKYADTGDLLYLWATNFGPEIWRHERVIYHYHIWKIQFRNELIDKQYLYTWLLTDKERIKQSTNGTTMVHITKSIIEEREFTFPDDVMEQKVIGHFFVEINKLITSQTQKIEHAKRLKNAFMQKMFI